MWRQDAAVENAPLLGSSETILRGSASAGSGDDRSGGPTAGVGVFPPTAHMKSRKQRRERMFPPREGANDDAVDRLTRGTFAVSAVEGSRLGGLFGASPLGEFEDATSGDSDSATTSASGKGAGTTSSVDGSDNTRGGEPRRSGTELPAWDSNYVPVKGLTAAPLGSFEVPVSTTPMVEAESGRGWFWGAPN